MVLLLVEANISLSKSAGLWYLGEDCFESDCSLFRYPRVRELWRDFHFRKLVGYPTLGHMGKASEVTST
jgi:hypothetical protein